MSRLRGNVGGLSGNLQGMTLMLLAGFLFVVDFAMIRQASATLHPFEVSFFRNIFGLLVLVPWLFRQGAVPLKTDIFHLHLLRASLYAVGALCLFFAISITPLARITALGYLVPIFTTIGAIAFLGERVSLRRWTAILFGFAGTFVIIRPGFESIDLGTVLRLIASLFLAGVLTLTKVMTRTDSSATIIFYGNLLMVPMFLLAALFFWEWPSVESLAWLAAIGFISTVSLLIFTQALKIADANVIMPLDFLQLIWAAAFGFLLFAEVPNRFTFIGGFMIFASMTYIAWRESQLARTSQSVGTR
jgi:drug/metabolite transporter (DMT)-like permease